MNLKPSTPKRALELEMTILAFSWDVAQWWRAGSKLKALGLVPAWMDEWMREEAGEREQRGRRNGERENEKEKGNPRIHSWLPYFTGHLASSISLSFCFSAWNMKAELQKLQKFLLTLITIKNAVILSCYKLRVLYKLESMMIIPTKKVM